MSIRIEIELTSSTPDGSWTWRAAGAREPRGVLDGSILPPSATVGDQFRVETEKDIEGIRVVSVVPSKEKGSRSDLLALLPTEENFEPVIQQRVPGRRDDGPRRPRREGGPGGDDRRGRRREGGDRVERRDGASAGRRSDRPPGDRSGGDRPSDADRRDRGAPSGGDRGERSDARRRQRPHFTPPPEVPQRPKPKRLRPGKQHRIALLESLPEEQRPVAELAQQGLAAVRQRLREDNARLAKEGKPLMPEAAVMRMAEDLIPSLRVADWLDRAEAAQRQLEHLDLRDLRSVIAAADDPAVARDESTRDIATALKAALVTKQEEELTLWFADVEAALDVGRVVRALRLSSVPPKAGVPFPTVLAARLADATTASLQPADGPDRWVAVLEAAAFSPVRALVKPTAPAEQRSDELLATVRRLGPLLPQVAVIFEVEVPAGAPVPKPLRVVTRRPEPKKAAPRPARGPAPQRTSAAKAEHPAAGDDTAPTTVAERAEPSAEETSLAAAATDEPVAAADAPAVEGAPAPGLVDGEPGAHDDPTAEPTPASDAASDDDQVPAGDSSASAATSEHEHAADDEAPPDDPVASEPPADAIEYERAVDAPPPPAEEAQLDPAADEPPTDVPVEREAPTDTTPASDDASDDQVPVGDGSASVATSEHDGASIEAPTDEPVANEPDPAADDVPTDVPVEAADVAAHTTPASDAASDDQAPVGDSSASVATPEHHGAAAEAPTDEPVANEPDPAADDVPTDVPVEAAAPADSAPATDAHPGSLTAADEQLAEATPAPDAALAGEAWATDDLSPSDRPAPDPQADEAMALGPSGDDTHANS